MLERILVPLRDHDRITEILPYLGFVARPGMEIVFLLRSDEHRYPWWSEHAGTLGGASERASSIGTLEIALARQRCVLSAEEQVARARKFLQAKGVAVRIELYTGSIKNFMTSYSGEDSETMILISNKLTVVRRLRIALRQWFTPVAKDSVAATLLLHPHRNI